VKNIGMVLTEMVTGVLYSFAYEMFKFKYLI
jgi:hypothetical protein